MESVKHSTSIACYDHLFCLNKHFLEDNLHKKPKFNGRTENAWKTRYAVTYAYLDRQVHLSLAT